MWIGNLMLLVINLPLVGIWRRLLSVPLRAYGFEPTPLLLGFVLSQPFEEHFRRAMLFSDNDLTTFLTHPVSATLVAITVMLLVLSALPAIRRARQILQ
jgi:putative tricarboxylic transport membrane protein